MLGIFASLVGDSMNSFFKNLMNVIVKSNLQRDKFVDCTSFFSVGKNIKLFKETKIKSDQLDIRIFFSKVFYYEVFLSHKEMCKKLSLDVKCRTECLEININYFAGDGKGYINIYLPELNKIDIVCKKSDIVVNLVKVKQLEIANNSGDVILQKFHSEDVQINNFCGDIILHHQGESYLYDVKTRGGDVVKNGIHFLTSGKRVKCRNKNGDIILNVKDDGV